MYKQFDIVELMKQSSIDKCLQDRRQYIPFLDCAKKFAIENKMTILNLPKQSELDLFTYTFFTFNASKMAHLLAIKLFEVSPLGRYTKVITKIRDYIYVISVNERELCTITDIPNYKGARVTDILGTAYVDDMLYIGDEIQSIILYKQLCNPAEEKNWTFIEKTLGIQNEPVTGSSEPDKPNEEDPEDIMTRAKLYSLIYDMVRKPDNVLIGNGALQLLNGATNIDKEQRLQLVTTHNLSVFQKMFKQSNVTTSIANLQLFVDPRLCRLTIYVNKEPFIDVFNAGTYELLPFTVVRGMCVGSKYLLMCYRLIDIWTMRLLLGMKVIKSQYAETMISIFKKQFDSMQKLPVVPTLFTGTIVNYELFIKRNNNEINYPFYPLSRARKQ